MTKREGLAYVAGIIDGEGCISIHKNTSKTGWTLRVCVDMYSKKIIDTLVGIAGGRYCAVENPSRKFVIYYWYLLGKNAYELLKKIKPYLKEKKAQADVAIQFHIHQRSYFRKKKSKATEALTEQEIKIRERYKQRLSDLKTEFLTSCRAPAETKREDTVTGEAIVQPN